jgi:hypothetical protein
MDAKRSQPQIIVYLLSLATTLCFLVISGLAVSNAQEQNPSLSLATNSICGSTDTTDVKLLENVSVLVNGQTYRTDENGSYYSFVIPSGAIQIRASAPDIPNAKLAFVDYNETNLSGFKRYYADSSGTVTFNVVGYGGLAQIYLNRCTATEARIKVITTLSMTLQDAANGVVQPVSDANVQIGDKPVQFDNEGIGFVTIRPETYKMSMSRGLGSTIGYIRLKETKSGADQSVLHGERAGSNGSIKEANVSFSASDANSGNLYDYELTVHFLSELVPCNTCEVHVISVQPGVQVHKAGRPEDEWIPATLDMVLKAGDEISCDPDGAIMLRFRDGATTVVKNTTQLKIGSYFTEGGIVRTEILLKMGEVAAQINKSEATKSDFRIKAPTGTTSSRDTAFTVRYDPQTQTSTVSVDEGVVVFTPTNPSLQPITVRARQQIQVSMNSVGTITSYSGDGAGSASKRAWLYVGIAFTSLLMLGPLFFFFRRRHRLARQPAFHPSGMNPTGWNTPPVNVASPVFDKPSPKCPNPQCGKEALVGQELCEFCGAHLNA